MATWSAASFAPQTAVSETKYFRSKGSEARARRAPVFKRGFIRIVDVEPFTREQYVRCFGEGRM